jgi:hypothetical protein
MARTIWASAVAVYRRCFNVLVLQRRISLDNNQALAIITALRGIQQQQEQQTEALKKIAEALVKLDQTAQLK